jgi:hypothetical protein
MVGPVVVVVDVVEVVVVVVLDPAPVEVQVLYAAWWAFTALKPKKPTRQRH